MAERSRFTSRVEAAALWVHTGASQRERLLSVVTTTQLQGRSRLLRGAGAGVSMQGGQNTVFFFFLSFLIPILSLSSWVIFFTILSFFVLPVLPYLFLFHEFNVSSFSLFSCYIIYHLIKFSCSLFCRFSPSFSLFLFHFFFI